MIALVKFENTQLDEIITKEASILQKDTKQQETTGIQTEEKEAVEEEEAETVEEAVEEEETQVSYNPNEPVWEKIFGLH